MLLVRKQQLHIFTLIFTRTCYQQTQNENMAKENKHKTRKQFHAAARFRSHLVCPSFQCISVTSLCPSLQCTDLSVSAPVCLSLSAHFSLPTSPYLRCGQGQVLVAAFKVTNQVSPQQRSLTPRARPLDWNQVAGVALQEMLCQAGHVTDHAAARPEAGQALRVCLKEGRQKWLSSLPEKQAD